MPTPDFASDRPMRDEASPRRESRNLSARFRASASAYLLDDDRRWTVSDMRAGPTGTFFGVAATIIAGAAALQGALSVTSGGLKSKVESLVATNTDVASLLGAVASPGLLAAGSAFTAILFRGALVYAGGAKIDFVVGRNKRPQVLGLGVALFAVWLAVAVASAITMYVVGADAVSNLHITTTLANGTEIDRSKVLTAARVVSAAGFGFATFILIYAVAEDVLRVRELQKPTIQYDLGNVLKVQHESIPTKMWNARWPEPDEESPTPWLMHMGVAADSHARHITWLSEAALIVLGAVFGASIGKNTLVTFLCIVMALVLAFYRGPFVQNARTRSKIYIDRYENRLTASVLPRSHRRRRLGFAGSGGLAPRVRRMKFR